MSHKSDILKKIKNKTLTVGVIGLGYVGLPLVLRFNKIGFKVIGFDNDNMVIKSLRAGRSYINHISESDIKNLIKKNFEVTSDYNKITETDFTCKIDGGYFHPSACATGSGNVFA